MYEIAIGLIGAGGIMPYHVAGLRAIEGVRLVGVHDINRENLRARAQEFGLVAYQDRDDLLGSDIDAVFVIAPAVAHVRHCVAAAGAGKHIFCEKPLALTTEDADAIIAAAERARVKLMVGFNNNFRPVTRQLRAIFESGDLGRLVTVWDRQFVYRNAEFWSAKRGQLDEWRLDMSRSGGRMTEFGSHSLNWAQFIGGQPVSVYGRMDTVAETLGDVSVDDTDLAIVAFERGFANIELSLSPAVLDRRSVGTMGDRGCARCADGGAILLRRDRRAVAEQVPVSSEGETAHQHFIRCLREDLRPEVDGQSARTTVQLCEAFLRSARTGEIARIG